ncbi:hypothetical protein KI387_024932 [Taxus chinensis]|uniref:Uncharacterized protein n=1 Tax=Taxus chinensis TaxID=29808 RepID=A0AA38G6Q8_TAXCH|nr:hypothetical protein KI387_024932 [Taxus chinensis]
MQVFDALENSLTSTIPHEVRNLKFFSIFLLDRNNLSGQIPESIGELTYLESLSLYENTFTGPLPPKLGSLSKFNTMDVSQNRLNGSLPKDICKGGNMQYFLALENSFSGELLESYGHDYKSLLRFMVNNNNLSGKVPDGIWGQPNANIIDLSFNQYSKEISPEIRNAKNLSWMIIHNNRFSGALVPQIGMAAELSKIDAHNNLLTGPIPKENRLEGVIPATLGDIQDLSSLNLSNNELSGSIPAKLGFLKLSSVDFSNNHLVGPVSNSLLTVGNRHSFAGNPRLRGKISGSNNVLRVCSVSHAEKETNKMKLAAGFVVVAATGKQRASIYIHVCEYIVGSNLSLSSASSWPFSGPSAGIYVQNGCCFAGDGKSHGFLDSCWPGCLDGSPSFSFGSLNPVGEGFLPVGVKPVDDNAGEDMEVCMQGNLDIREEGNMGAWKGEKMHDLNYEEITLDLTLGLSNLKSFP